MLQRKKFFFFQRGGKANIFYASFFSITTFLKSFNIRVGKVLKKEKQDQMEIERESTFLFQQLFISRIKRVRSFLCNEARSCSSSYMTTDDAKLLNTNDDKLCRKTAKTSFYLDNLEITRINAPFSSRNLVLSFFRCSNC